MKFLKFGLRLWITDCQPPELSRWLDHALLMRPNPASPAHRQKRLPVHCPHWSLCQRLSRDDGNSVQNQQSFFSNQPETHPSDQSPFFSDRWIMIRSIEFRAMNTTVLLAADGERAIDGMQAAKAFIDECEQRFSRFLPASELTELNRSAGEWIQVSDDLMEMLELALKYHRRDPGHFRPSHPARFKTGGLRSKHGRLSGQMA